VHENHLFVAVILVYMLMLHERTGEHWAIVTILAVMFNVNLFVFYGVTGTELQSRVVGVELSVVLAMLYAVAWADFSSIRLGRGAAQKGGRALQIVKRTHR
jgi:uncharacterized membrane protein YecN with MAPEG domain